VLVHDTDPLDADSDDDGSSDGQEVNVQGTDPLDPNEGGTAEVPAMGAMGVAMLGASLIAAGALAARRRRLS